MIVGNGDIASVLQEVDRPDLLFLASGVSNSQETDEAEYARELDLVLDQDRGLHAVYFSSLAVFYGATRYVEHKRSMERVVQEEFPTHTIVRIGNISWGTNPNTLINHLRGQQGRGEELDIRDAERYIVDEDEFLHWVGKIPLWSCEMNIPGRRMTIKEVVDEYVTNDIGRL